MTLKEGVQAQKASSPACLLASPVSDQWRNCTVDKTISANLLLRLILLGHMPWGVRVGQRTYSPIISPLLADQKPEHEQTMSTGKTTELFARYLIALAATAVITCTTSGREVAAGSWSEQCSHVQTVHTVQSNESPMQLMHASYPGMQWTPMWALVALCNPQIAAFDPGTDGQAYLPHGQLLKLPTFQIPKILVHSPVAAASSQILQPESVSAICGSSVINVTEAVSWLQLATSAYPAFHPAVVAATLLAICNPQAKLLPNQLLEPRQQLLGLRGVAAMTPGNSTNTYASSADSGIVAVSAAATAGSLADSRRHQHDDEHGARYRRRKEEFTQGMMMKSRRNKESRSDITTRWVQGRPSSSPSARQERATNSSVSSWQQQQPAASSGSIKARRSRATSRSNFAKRASRGKRPGHTSSDLEDSLLPVPPPAVGSTAEELSICQVTSLTSSGPVRRIEMSQSCSWLSDGCSGPSNILQYQDVLTPCCHAHDYCYYCAHTLGWTGVTSRQECDRKMKNNMLAVCQNAYDIRGWWDWDHKWNKFWCENTAEVMFAAVWAYQELKAGSISFAGEYDCSGDVAKLAATDFCFHR